MKNTFNIPAHTFAALERYVEHRLPPGGFLEAVLANDLVGAAGAADAMNEEQLVDIVQLCYHELPHNIWGSREAVDRWLYGERR